MTRSSAIAMAVSVLFGAGMWLYVGRVLVPQEKEFAATHGIPRGNLSDLYPRWQGARDLLLNRKDPYSAEVTREIQSGYFGRPLDPARPSDPHDQEAFAYPVYVAFVLAPTVNLPFPAVQEFFRWLLAGLTVFSVFLWMRVMHWRPSWVWIAVVVLLTLATFPAVQGIRLQQLSLLVAALLAGAIYLLSRNQQTLAGILLALATIKPQLALPLAAWLLLWALSRLSWRWKFAASFAATSAAMIIGGEILLPGWVHEFYRAAVAYRSYTGAASILDQLSGPIEGAALAVVVVVAVAYAAWSARKHPADTDEGDRFYVTTSLVLAATVVIIPSTAPYNQLLLLPGALLIARTWHHSGQTRATFRALRSIAAVCVIWPWISSTILAVVSFVTPASQRFWQVPLWTSIAIPIPITACVGLLIRQVSPEMAKPH